MASRSLRSVATRRFWERYEVLPGDVQSLAVKTYQLWREDPKHPSLHFRLLEGSKHRFSIRVGLHYRALGHLRSGTMTWVWIGTHAEYDRLVS